MGIILVYDITSAKTFENISKWLRNIDEVMLRHNTTLHSQGHDTLPDIVR